MMLMCAILGNFALLETPLFAALVAYRLSVICCFLLQPDCGILCLPGSVHAHYFHCLFALHTRYPKQKSTVLVIKFGLLFYGVTRVAQLALLVALFCFYDRSDPTLSDGMRVFAIGGGSILMVMPKLHYKFLKHRSYRNQCESSHYRVYPDPISGRPGLHLRDLQGSASEAGKFSH